MDLSFSKVSAVRFSSFMCVHSSSNFLSASLSSSSSSWPASVTPNRLSSSRRYRGSRFTGSER